MKARPLNKRINQNGVNYYLNSGYLKRFKNNKVEHWSNGHRTWGDSCYNKNDLGQMIKISEKEAKQKFPLALIVS